MKTLDEIDGPSTWGSQPRDTRVALDGDTCVALYLRDVGIEELEDKGRTKILLEIIQTLDIREKAILRSRFGLDGEFPKTLEETAKELGISSERVRQLQKAALKKLRLRIKSRENGVPLKLTKSLNGTPRLSARFVSQLPDKTRRTINNVS